MREWLQSEHRRLERDEYCTCADEQQETPEHSITLREDDEKAVAAMIYYLYHGDYKATISKDADTAVTVFHLRVSALGDKYDVAGLYALARGYLLASARVSWHSDDFTDAVREAYGSETYRSDMRRSIVHTAEEHIGELMAPGSKYQRFQEVLRSNNKFSFDLMQKMVESRKTNSGISPLVPNARGPPVDGSYFARFCSRCQKLFFDGRNRAAAFQNPVLCGSCYSL